MSGDNPQSTTMTTNETGSERDLCGLATDSKEKVGSIDRTRRHPDRSSKAHPAQSMRHRLGQCTHHRLGQCKAHHLDQYNKALSLGCWPRRQPLQPSSLSMT